MSRVQTPPGPADRAIRPMGRVGLLVSPLNKVIFRRVRIAAVATTARKEPERWRSAARVWRDSLALLILFSISTKKSQESGVVVGFAKHARQFATSRKMAGHGERWRDRYYLSDREKWSGDSTGWTLGLKYSDEILI